MLACLCIICDLVGHTVPQAYLSRLKTSWCPFRWARHLRRGTRRKQADGVPRETVCGACSVQSANLDNLQIGQPFCQSQTGQPICKWDDQSENLFEVFLSKFSTQTVLSHTLLLFKLTASTQVSRIE